jgi:hypothetical protein
MAQDVCVIVGAEDRARLAAVVGDRNRSTIYVTHKLTRSAPGWSVQLSPRPDGAYQQWMRFHPDSCRFDLVAGNRLGRATGLSRP